MHILITDFINNTVQHFVRENEKIQLALPLTFVILSNKNRINQLNIVLFCNYLSTSVTYGERQEEQYRFLAMVNLPTLN